jgi:HSP20 family protein
MARTSAKPSKVVHITREKAKPAASGSALRPMDEMERMWENFFSHNWMRPSQWELPWLGEFPMPFERRMMPKVDIVDRDRELVLRAQVPGVEKKDLEVTMTDTMVTIEGSVHQEEKEKKGDYFRRECAWGTFTRSIALPCEVDSAKATATLEDGMLVLHLPKMTESKRRTVAIE